ncbi:MAG TPA: antitoxin Xre/MbcA/ParS toxin-binding domain-containing protein [Puia sp.]|jgi:putative toxin-antitoxin system antitoxin component (TIGR02293 family)
MTTATKQRKTRELFKEYQEELSNPILLVFTAEKGLAVTFFDELISVTNLNKKTLADIIDATTKTIDNRRTSRVPLGRTKSEQLLQILALYRKGIEIFGATDSFNEWLKQPAAGLGGRIPFEFMYTSGGIRLVMEELIRIEFGALA